MESLDDGTVTHILEFLDASIDIAHASLVSRAWRQSVIEGRLWRKLCIKRFPELEKVTLIEELLKSFSATSLSESSRRFQCTLQEEHRIYCHLFTEISGDPLPDRTCINVSISASSTDNSPLEGIHETLFPNARRARRDVAGWSYWSSSGQLRDDVPETLTYELLSPLCVVHEIKLRPFKAGFQPQYPIYSSKSVRFRLGFPSQAVSIVDLFGCNGSDEVEYTWTYESPEYPVEQEDRLQSFKLPRPVLCLGQILQVELLGRAQTQQSDSLYYICVCHVSVSGRPISNFDFRFMGDNGGYVLIYSGNTDANNCWDRLDSLNFVVKENADDRAFGWHYIIRRVRQLRFLWHNRLFSRVRRGGR